MSAVVEASAPARVLLARGLALAVDRRATCRLELAPGQGVALAWKDALARAEAASLAALRAPTALLPMQRLLSALDFEAGLRVEASARVPIATGLAPDVALIVALAAAGLRGRGCDVAPDRVMELATRALRDGGRPAPTALDAWSAVRGGASLDREDGPLSLAVDPAWIEQALWLGDVGAAARDERRAGTASADERALAAALAHALSARDGEAVPGLIAHGWEATCVADPGALTPEADGALRLARAAGGAGRPCGAGGGGLLLLWLPVATHKLARERLGEAGVRTYPCRVDLLGLEVAG